MTRVRRLSNSPLLTLFGFEGRLEVDPK